MRVMTSADEPAMIVIEARDGVVHASLGTTSIQLPPNAVSRLINLYREAQTVAIQQRGGW